MRSLLGLATREVVLQVLQVVVIFDEVVLLWEASCSGVYRSCYSRLAKISAHRESKYGLFIITLLLRLIFFFWHRRRRVALSDAGTRKVIDDVEINKRVRYLR